MQEVFVGLGIEDVSGFRNMRYLVHKNEPDIHDINMDEQHGYLDYGIVAGHISGEWDEYN
jgi:hypothetical protein